MNRMVFAMVLSLVTGLGGVSAQTKRENPRPAERPSRTVEELLKRQAAAKTAAAEAEAKTAAARGVPTGEAAGGEAAGGEGAVGEGAVGEGAVGEGAKKAGAKAPSVFRVSGAEVWEAASRAGWKFFPKGATGAMDGRNTVVEIQPGIVYSTVQGPVVTQRRTLPGWGKVSENTFYLFTDARGRAKSLASGWTVQDLRLTGDLFEWVSRPASGGSTPSLAIRVAGGRSARDSVVRLEGIVLQGPPEAKDWREAFGGR